MPKIKLRNTRKKSPKCKCCNTLLSNKSNNHLIFDTSGREKNIQFLLSDCVGKQVEEFDGLDQAICNDCLEQLQQTFSFKQKCRNQIENENVSDECTEDENEDCDYESDISVNDRNTISYVESIPDTRSFSYEVNEQDDIFTKEEEFAGFDDEDTKTTILGITYYDADEQSHNNQLNHINLDPTVIDNNMAMSSIGQTDDNSSTFVNDPLTLRVIDAENDAFSELKFEMDNEECEVINETCFYRTSLTECLTAQTYKEYLRKDIPIHQIVPKRTSVNKSSTSKKQQGGEDEPASLDVEKIVTSDDLIKILEDDYHSENDSKRKRLDKDTDGEEFKIPEIKILDVCEKVDYQDDAIDIDEYIMSVVCASYDEELDFLSAITCSVSKYLVYLYL